MIKKFGVKEADLASKLFLTTAERKTVLKTLKLLGIKNVLQAQLAKAQRRIFKAVGKNDIAICKLTKLHDEKKKIEREKLAELDNVGVTKAMWTL